MRSQAQNQRDWQVWQAAHASLMARLPVEELEAAIDLFKSFKGMVITSKHPAKDAMAKILQDAHEFECEKTISALTQLLEQK
jgi:hypothetical protein